MPVVRVKPTSNARRKLSYLKYDIDKVKPEKSLTFGIKRNSGRSSAGELVVMHKGGGAKRKYLKASGVGHCRTRPVSKLS